MADLTLRTSASTPRHEANPASGTAGVPDPASAFSDPREVLGASGLSGSDKRALLASWASDACAVEGMPAWRRLPGSSALVPVDEILEALRALDRGGLH